MKKATICLFLAGIIFGIAIIILVFPSYSPSKTPQMPQNESPRSTPTVSLDFPTQVLYKSVHSLTYGDVLALAIEGTGYPPTGGRCMEDTVMYSTWKGTQHSPTVCIPLDDVVGDQAND